MPSFATPAAPPDWQKKAHDAYSATQAKIPEAWRVPEALLAPAWVYPEDCDAAAVEKHVRPVHEQLLSADELRIVKSDASELLRHLAAGTWSALDVMTAFCKSAAIAQQLYRCCTELFFDRALERARQLDAEYAQTGKVVGPLHGLPISLKDQYELKGIRTTMGLSSLLDHVGKQDAAIVQALESQGAVIFVKTNVPMSMMSADSVNAVWGRVANPCDRTRTAGGSSGGEGALIAAFGSPLGVGSDIAGSIRIPSAMCGTYGLKPSTGRLPLGGGMGCGAGAEFVPPVNGPLARSVDSLELFMEAVIGTKPWTADPHCIRMPWTPVDLRNKSLRIGILRDNGMVRPHPPIERALRDVEAALTSAGHTVVEWTAAEMHVQAHSLARAFFRQDGGANLRSFVGDEPVLPNVDTGCPDFVLSAPEMVGKHWQTVGLRAQYLQRWRALELDAVICPVASHVATGPNEYNDITNTLPWNLLQYPVTVVPVSKVTEDDIDSCEEYERYEPRPLKTDSFGLYPEHGDADNLALWLDGSKRKGFVGLPIGMQIVCPPYMDEQCLAVARVLDSMMK